MTEVGCVSARRTVNSANHRFTLALFACCAFAAHCSLPLYSYFASRTKVTIFISAISLLPSHNIGHIWLSGDGGVNDFSSTTS